ncbi:MAG: tetratricopeptide repeat protein [Terracidiphilus sp.]|nr:tetratricopeptide repeat protein [Terracidiphilus sp.]MDR3775623.1 tetratricopeptide repeat protein [Terracidiphilus sp.]
MQTTRTFRNRLLSAAVLGMLLVSSSLPAHAASKEIIELQTQVQQLMDMVQRIQSTLDTRLGVITHLAEQTADDANRVTATVNALQAKINAQNEAGGGKIDSVSGQVQSLNDSVDELKSRIAKLDKSIQELQTQSQATQAPPAGAAPMAGSPAPGAPSGAQAPPLQETFQAGVRDYNAAHYEVAAGEFQDVLHYYPLDDMAGTAQFYLGEIAYRQQNYAEAVKAYNAVLEGFSGNAKAPAAQLRKGLSLLQMNKKEAGIHELRLLIQRHPQTPEAAQARTKLNGLGARVNAR